MPFPFASTTYVDPELVTSANFYSRVLAVLNTYVGGFLYGEAEGLSTDTVTLTATATDFIVPVANVTFVLSQQRRVRIVVRTRYAANTAPGSCDIYPTYVAGGSATLTGATKLGNPNTDRIIVNGTGAGAAVTGTAEHTVLLAAGTWTAFCVANRFGGGSATDVAGSGYCAVYDAGGS
jgi:hypothetical protein